MKDRKLLLAVSLVLTAFCAFASGGAANEPYPNFGLPRVEQMMFLVLQIGVIIFAARVGGAIASALKLPSILGELGAGIVIEKAYQEGGNLIRSMGVRVESLAKIASMSVEDGIVFCD